MVDTPRTVSDLLTSLFQDGQAAGSISANDIRDLIVSFKTNYGGFHLNASANTTISVAGTYYSMNGTTNFDSSNSVDFSLSTNNQLKYTGSLTKKFIVAATASIDVASGSNQDIGLTIAKNGTALTDSEMHAVVSASGDGKLLSSHHIVELSTNDYIGIYFTNVTATNAVVVNYADLHAISLIV